MKSVAAILTDKGWADRFTKDYQDLISTPRQDYQETNYKFERELNRIWYDQKTSKLKAELETKLFTGIDKT